MRPRWLKMLRDAWLHKSRTLLVVLAVATGLTGAGAILDTWALVQRVTAETYVTSHPVSATLRVDAVDDALLAQVRAMPGIAAVRARRVAVAKSASNGRQLTAELFALRDFQTRDIGRLESVQGHWPPRDGEIVLEKSSLELSGAEFGGSLSFALKGKPPQALKFTGIARDVGLPPGWMDHVVYGFVTPGTMAQLGSSAAFDELQFVVSDTNADREAVRRIAYDVKAGIERNGHRVAGVDVPVPGAHPHAAQMNSLTLTQGAFGLLTLLVASFLIVNLMTAMLAGQAREIGVMKTLGARPDQIGAMYLGFAAMVGLFASAIALPAAIALARPYATMQTDMLNFPIAGHAIPWWAIGLQLAVGCLLPVLAALAPVASACRLPVNATLRDPGISAGGGSLHLQRRIAIPGLGRPLLLAIGNAFRRRQRMLLTLLALAFGGAVFLGADNLRSSVRGSVDMLFTSQHYDIVLGLAEPHPAATIEAVAARVEGIARVQSLASETVSLAHGDGMIGDKFSLVGVPPATPMLTPVIVEGRWLNASDRDAIVVSRALLKDEPSLKTGAVVSLPIGDKSTQWHVVGVIESGPASLAYTSLATLQALHGNTDSSTLVITATRHDSVSGLDAIQRLRDAFEGAGIPVANSQLSSDTRVAVEDHLSMVVGFLGVMGWVMIAIGGMGLASTMSLAVLERTREIGVMRAIGARHGTIMRMFQAEGLLIAILGWLLSVPLSVPMSVTLSNTFGKVMFTVPTHIVPNAGGLLRWLAMIVAVSVVACALPSWRAMRIPTAAALSYE